MKRTASLFCLIAVLLAFNNQLCAKSWYVSASGSNSNAGTQALPFKTIQFGLDKALPGDSVLVEAGTYKEKINVNNSGITGKFIYLIGKNKPLIDGTGLTPSGQEGLIDIINKSYIHVEGFEIANFITSNSFPVGIWVEGRGGFITIKNNYIHHIQCNKGAHGVAFYGTSSQESLHDIVFEGNEVAFCNTYSSEATVWNGNVRGFLVRNNSVHDCDNIAYDFIGWEGTCGSCSGNSGANVDRARDGIVKNNIAYNITSWGNPAYGNSSAADGFYVDGGDSIVFEYNIARSCDLGFELASEHYGKTTSNIVVRNNLIYNNYAVGLSTGGYSSGTGAGGGNTINCRIVNNTFYKNNTSPNNDAWGAELLLQNRNSNNFYANNILYAAPGFPLVDLSGQYNTNNGFSNNLYFGSTAGTKPGSAAVNANPLFLNETIKDFHLQSNSPAINKGLNASDDTTGAFDFYNSIRKNGIVDIGAAEFQSSTDVFTLHKKDPFFLQLYPNPGHQQLHLDFILEKEEACRAVITDISGRILEILVDKKLVAGFHTIEFTMDAGGIYILLFQTSSGVISRNVVVN